MKTRFRQIAFVFVTVNFAAALALRVAANTDVPDAPFGIYKQIDVRLATDTMKALREFKGGALAGVIGSVTNKPEEFAPPVLYVLSSVMFEQGRKDEAVFWFHAGQLRGLIDANLCADKSAMAVINAMNQKFGAPIKQYCLTNIPVLTNIVDRVVTWEGKTPCHYDRRWINLHLMNPTSSETDATLSVPQAQWEAIRERTREEYAFDFHKALDSFNQRKH